MPKPDKSNPFLFNNDDVEIINRDTLFQGFFKIDQVEFKHKLFAGGWSKTVTREVFERGNAVAVLLFDFERDEIVLLEQIRIGCMLNSDKPWMMELVGGMIEPGEEIEEVAHRETQEEAGLTIQSLMPMTHYLSSAGGTTERIYLYLANVDATQAGEICGLEYEDEDIRVHRVSRAQAVAWLEDGTIENAATYIALQWLELHMQDVIKAWKK
ncbi:ADP-ribose diphosphatase [Catenovulum sp. SM1970]|uniref:ADP-ribose diphosphatase n=1 Tax=Marinifaba aquimaris TaxID=2741323 RepID=UPI001573E571|nr:ADP-ribose diphosphatase [Marinifaba aquimaris]